jgi:hypothetical protein
MTKFVKVAIFAPLVLALSIVLHMAGWNIVYPERQAAEVPGTALNSPAIVKDTFGPKVALLFPPVMLAACTLMGILSNILWTYAADPNKKLGWRSFAPVLVSPIALFSFYKAASTEPDTVVAALMAFQNGFFWQTILEKRTK